MTEMPDKPVILAIDDTPDNLYVVQDILAPHYTVKAAINGPMALKIVEKHPPDLILLDIMMPDMDGYEVCKRLKSNPESKDIPIIFLTAMDQTTDESKGFVLGAADYITKPVNPPILEARVKTHLAFKQAMDDLQGAYAIIKRQKDRMQEELNVGHTIQMSMLPVDFPAFPERTEFDLHGLLKPAREVGGDFYDFFMISEDELCLVVGDVSGKGVPAALFMAVTQTMIKTASSGDRSPASIVTRVNDALSSDNPASMFVTLFLAIVDIRTGRFRYCNAGHNPPYVVHPDDRLTCLNQRHGVVMGALPGLAYGEDEMGMEKGDKLFIFTDGVTEAMDRDGELFGETRLEKFLNDTDCPTAQMLTGSTLQAVEGFAIGAEQADDITILAYCLQESPKGFQRDSLELSVVADTVEIERVQQAIGQFAAETKMSSGISQKMSVILDELLNNTISYGFEDPKGHEIHVAMELNDDHVTIRVSDDGIPFNPFTHRAPDTSLSAEEREIGGLGVMLVRELTDSHAYQRLSDRNVVTLTIKLETRS